MTFFGFSENALNLLGVNSLECVSISNQECKARPKIIDVDSDEPVFYPYSFVEVVIEVVMVSMIRMLNCVLQISLKHKCQSIQFNAENQ